MSDPINSFRGSGGWDQASSRNAGQWQAQQNQPSSPQQTNESFASFQQRQSAYDANKRSY